MISTSAGRPLQLSLQQPESFIPVPNGPRHYVVALQTQPGELDALKHASSDTWRHLTPLIEIVGPKKKPTKPFSKNRVRGWLKRIAGAVDQHPFFLDLLRLPPLHGAESPDGIVPVLGAIYAAARGRALQFVPVLPFGASVGSQYSRLVLDAALSDGRGLALRYPLLEIAPPPRQNHTTLLTERLRGLHIDVAATDILIDLAYLSEDEELAPEDIAEALNEIEAVGAWRSFVLLGTSIPRMLGGGVIDEGAVGAIPRREWHLWNALREVELKRIPTFGDYAIQHPHPPAEEQSGGSGMRANIRYTIDDATVVARGVGPVVQVGKEQYRELCQMLTGHDLFAGKAFSWGDALIEACAAGYLDPGWQRTWRGAGTSHHLRVVTDQLSQQAAA